MTRARSIVCVALCLASAGTLGCGGTVDTPLETDATTDDTSDTSITPADAIPETTPDTTSDTTPPPTDVPIDSLTCDPPKKICGVDCVDVASDTANCGDCGKACAPGQSCTAGACVCPSPKITCGTSCVDVSIDVANCGACGKACTVGASCLSGVCSACPTSKPTICGAAPGTCVDLTTDPKNCGKCGTSCGLGTCTAGACVCGSGTIICAGIGCTDVSTDVNNCGACAKKCPTGATCTSGICSCPVAKPDTCGAICTDKSTDTNHCGACFNKCAVGATCTAGKCACPTGKTDICYGVCLDKMTDPGHCGACDVSCGSGTCVSGVCSCGTLTKCGSTCSDTTSDPLNCGGCGTVCPAGQVCSSSSCVVPKCRTTAPNVLFYGPLGALEKPYLPTGAISTTVDDAKWRSMSKTDFAKYDMIVLGAPDDGGFSYTTYAMMQAAFETRNVWGPAVNGRIVVLGLDPAFHASKGTAGAITFQKASLAWLATGGAGQTTLFVNTDWGNRKLDFLSPFGAFSSTSQASDKIVISKTTHPIMIGSTDATLSNWYGSAHSFVTFPSPFTSLANGTDTAGAKGEVVVVRDYACVP